MSNAETLQFDASGGQTKTCTLDGTTIQYRAFTDIPYCASPKDPIQKLNLFVPEAFYHGETINGYDLHTAPIFCPNSVGGYMPGPADEPGRDFKGRVNSIFRALEHGYVVCSAGVRGRTSGKVSNEFFEGGVVKNPQEAGLSETLCGKAPAFAVDMKAALRWLRANQGRIPGDTEKMIVSGTSAGGALAALVGASGNQEDFEPYLKEIGALEERDDVFAASCYCPIHNLENADTAYEWLFGQETTFHRMKKIRGENGELIRVQDQGDLTPVQREVSQKLKEQFPAYVNGLQLVDEHGQPLTLDEEGNGSFRQYVADRILDSYWKEKQTHQIEQTIPEQMTPGSAVDQVTYVVDGALEWEPFVSAITRMKPAPAFDDLNCKSPENEEFGTPEIPYQHFTPLAAQYSTTQAPMADAHIIAMMNPLTYIGTEGTAPNWRIRHGVYDRDTSLAIPVLLSLVLKNKGYDPDFFLPWGMPHAGDYDLDELFAWIDDKAHAAASAEGPTEGAKPQAD